MDTVGESKEQQLWQACTMGDLELVKTLSTDPSVDINWPDPEYLRSPFYRASGHGRVAVVEYLLKNPKIDVNQKQFEGGTALAAASHQGHCAVVSQLLASGRVDINVRNREGATSLFFAAQEGHTAVVELLLLVPEMDLNIPDCKDGSPLWIASQNGHLAVVEHILATDRDVNITLKSIAGTSPWCNKTALENARRVAARGKLSTETEATYRRKQRNCPLIAELLEKYEQDTEGTRRMLRERPGVWGTFTGQLFALVVLLSDDYLQLRGAVIPEHERWWRFFVLTRGLPMELQMVMCNRVYCSPKDLVRTMYSEPAFRRLGNLRTWGTAGP